MKKAFRLIALSALVLTALGFSAVGVMALTPAAKPELPTSSMTPEPKDLIVGTVTATDITSTEPVGTKETTSTAEPVEMKDSTSTVEPTGTETTNPDKNSPSGLNGSSVDKNTNNSSHDSGNGNGQNAGGSKFNRDSHNGSGSTSGSGPTDATGNSGN
jgi:hypothetical protein